MDKRPFFVLSAIILAGTFVAAEDAPASDALANATELELVVGTSDGAADNEYHPNVVDVSSGLPISQAPNETEAAPVPLGAPVPMAAPTRGKTKILVEKIRYKWTIINYQHHGMDYEEALYSPVFSGPNTPEYEWQLVFYPRGNDKLYKTFASLYLASVGKGGVRPEVSFHIVDHLGNPVNVKKFNVKKLEGEVYGFGPFVPSLTLELGYHKIWVPDDRLTLVAEITFSPGMKNIGHCTDFSSNRCLAMPYKNKENSDLRLFLANNENIRTQKATMMAHSTWIADRVRGDRINAVRLPANVIASDLTAALEFIYTGKVHPADAQRLKELADQLGMDRLKAMCEEVLCKSAMNSPANGQGTSAV